jgi:hypothetical protein
VEAPETVASASPESQHGRAEHGGSVNNIRINLGGATLIVVVFMASIIGACGLIMGLNLAKQDQMDRDFTTQQKQTALLERRYMDMEAYAILNGWKIPGDDTHGPTGNFERMKPKGESNGRR